jgi:hypothetical protein
LASEIKLTVSELVDFLNCPRQYKFKHIDKYPWPVSFALMRGRAVDEAVTTLFSNFEFWSADSGGRLQLIHDVWKAAFYKHLTDTKDSPSTGERMLIAYTNEMDVDIGSSITMTGNASMLILQRPVIQTLQLKADGLKVELRGRFDHLCQKVLRDIKIISRSRRETRDDWLQKRLSDSIQLRAYTLLARLTGHEVTHVGMDFLFYEHEASVVRKVILVDEPELAKLPKTIVATGAKILNGEFKKNTRYHLCDKQWCPCYTECMISA